jgi:predicted alpha/beta superfamily hydrolase
MKQLFLFTLLNIAAQCITAQDIATTKGNKPFVLGHIVELQSTILSEKRVLNIYLPDGYHENDTTRYPVIYLLDGSADEDFIHVVGLVQFMNFPWVNILPKSIVVGIANIDRKRDFTFPTTIEKDKKDFPTTGKSGTFINFLETELMPFIDQHYKTTSSNTIIGQSLGGLLATEILFKKPYLFSSYYIISPSLWWDRESLLSYQPEIYKPGFSKPLSIYIATGNEGKIMKADAKKLATVLQAGHKKNITVRTEYFNNENHASILHIALYKGFEILNKKAGIK